MKELPKAYIPKKEDQFREVSGRQPAPPRYIDTLRRLSTGSNQGLVLNTAEEMPLPTKPDAALLKGEQQRYVHEYREPSTHQSDNESTRERNATASAARLEGPSLELLNKLRLQGRFTGFGSPDHINSDNGIANERNATASTDRLEGPGEGLLRQLRHQDRFEGFGSDTHPFVILSGKLDNALNEVNEQLSRIDRELPQLGQQIVQTKRDTELLYLNLARDPSLRDLEGNLTTSESYVNKMAGFVEDARKYFDAHPTPPPAYPEDAEFSNS